jgi:hypothetical protein
MTLLAWVRKRPRLLPSFGTRRSRIEPLRPNQSLFYPQNTTNILALCPEIIIAAKNQVCRGQFKIILAPLLLFSSRLVTEHISHQPQGLFNLFLLQ